MAARDGPQVPDFEASELTHRGAQIFFQHIDVVGRAPLAERSETP
jgi:hypothetical protein